MTILERTLIYDIFPFLFAALHILLDRQARPRSRVIEVFILYLFVIGKGMNGVGAFFGHFFLSDLVAESIGWPSGNPFQLEMAFANLAVGVPSIMALDRRGQFRVATITAGAILSYGAFIVHAIDILETGNLAPGNTVVNIANLLIPTAIIALMVAARRAQPTLEATKDYDAWLVRAQRVVLFTAIGLASGFGLGFVLNLTLPVTILGAASGAAFAYFRRSPNPSATLPRP